METKPAIVISLGGSIIAPEKINSDFLKDFVNLIRSYTEKGFTFVIITGGGYVARNYIGVARNHDITNDDLDWIGISATRLNAEFLRVLFKDIAHDSIILDPDVPVMSQKPVIVGGGWKPGNSSDLAAVHIAITTKSKNVINLSNIDYVYDRDPRVSVDVNPIHEINWLEFRKLLPNEWDPGLNAPFDPIAAKVAEEFGVEVAIMNGNNLTNLRDYLDGKEFFGTKIIK